MSATIKIFHVGQRSFSHVLNTRHDSVELHDEFNEILLVYGADARVRDQRGRMGNFEAEYVDGQPHWVYYESCEHHDEREQHRNELFHSQLSLKSSNFVFTGSPIF